MTETKCRDCGSNMDIIKKEEKGHTVYATLKCSKCNKEVLRRE